MVRSILTEGEVPALDRRVRFVGLAAYEAAGGAVRRDLFSDGLEGVTLLDPAKLDDLVLAKLDIVAADLRTAGWRNVRLPSRNRRNSATSVRPRIPGSACPMRMPPNSPH